MSIFIIILTTLLMVSAAYFINLKKSFSLAVNKELKLLKNILQDKNLKINIELIKSLKKINKKLLEKNSIKK